MIQGSCLCGRVRYQIDGNASSFWLCHCSKCRRSTGGPFATAVLCRRSAFRFVSGEEAVKRFSTDSGYTTTFCGSCGSPAPMVRESEGSVVLSPGTLDDAYTGSLARHIFVGSRARWWEIADDAPRFDQHADQAPA